MVDFYFNNFSAFGIYGNSPGYVDLFGKSFMNWRDLTLLDFIAENVNELFRFSFPMPLGIQLALLFAFLN